MKINKEEVGEKIRQIRLSLEGRPNQTDFGQMIGAGKSTVSLYEKGDSLPDIITLGKIAELGGVSLDHFAVDQEESGAKAGPADKYPADIGTGIEATVNEGADRYQTGPLKISRQEEEFIYLLREIPADMQPIALEGVRNVWVMARRKRETSQDSE